MKILVIEDDLSLCDLYHSFLSKAGHQVDISTDGWEGFKKGGAGDSDLIITDLNMPHWDGATSIKSILELHPQLDFIVITGFPDSDFAQEIKNTPQVKHILTKPIDFNKLVKLIETL